MRQYRVFIIAVSFVMTFVTLWARTFDESHRGDRASAGKERDHQSERVSATPDVRRDLLETLDRIVTYQHYYRGVYGAYTRIISRLGVPIPKSVEQAYEIRVIEAAHERLLISALSESDGRVSDFVVVDHRYRVRANFSLPLPDAEYLKDNASKHLRALLGTPAHQEIAERGMFQGYFRFETERSSDGRMTARAVGLRAPVLGVELDVKDAVIHSTQLSSTLGDENPRTGQRETRDIASSMQEAYLAQRIFRGETGRYAKTWEELRRIAAFRFDDREAIAGNTEAQVPFGDRAMDIDMSPAQSRRGIAQVGSSTGEMRASPTDDPSQAQHSPLVIEPLRDATQ